MKKAKKETKKIKIANNYLGMAAIAVIVLMLLASLMMESKSLERRLAVYDAKAASLEQSIEDEKERTEEIDQLKEYMQTDEYAGEVAREKLGLVKDNEIVFEEEK